jgi:hypothetical protein
MKAFPLPSLTVKDNGVVLAFTVENPGMDLRDYFAGQALIGILSCDYAVDKEPTVLAYEYADEMMKERVQNGPQN